MFGHSISWNLLRFYLEVLIGPLQDTITYWDTQKREDLRLIDFTRFVLDVPAGSLRPSMADFYHVIVSGKGPIGVTDAC